MTATKAKRDSSNSTKTGTLTVVENIDHVVEEDYDPCAELSLAIEPNEEKKTICYHTPEQLEAQKLAKESGKKFVMMCMPMPVETEDGIGETPAPTNTRLSPLKQNGIELFGNNTVDLECCEEACRRDSYFVDRPSHSWEIEHFMPYPIAKYASGVMGDKIYFFGGCRDLMWQGENVFRSYNVKERRMQYLYNGGITNRADAYGWCMDGYFYMYGGYSVSLISHLFIHEFHRYSDAGGWTSLSVPTEKVTNKIIGGYGKIYIANAMLAGSPVGLEFDGGTYTYDGIWSNDYDGSDYHPDLYYNFDTFHFHKGIIYYYNEGKLREILPEQQSTTVGVEIPGLNRNPQMASYGNYIIFSHGVTDAGAEVILETSWFNTVTRVAGTFAIVGDVPQVAIGFSIHVIGKYLYKIGGIPEEGSFEHRIWRLDLSEFFANMDTCEKVPVPVDVRLEKQEVKTWRDFKYPYITGNTGTLS